MGVVKVDFATLIAQPLDVGGSRVWNILDGEGQIGWALHIMDEGLPGWHTTQASRQGSYECT